MKHINLLPPEEHRRLSREYLMRVGTVLLFAIAVVSGFGILMLAPAFVSSSAHLAALAHEKQSVQGAIVPGDLSSSLAIASTTRYLTYFATPHDTYITSIMRDVILQRPAGIRITSLSYDQSAFQDKTAVQAARLSISGIGATRDAVVNYLKAIRSISVISTATLPLSDLAANRDVQFTVVATLRSPTSNAQSSK